MKSVHKNKNAPYVVIVGLDHSVGLQTARILSRRGLPVVGIAKNPKHFACRTNVCEKIFFSDTLSDKLIPTLISFGQQLETKAVLFPCRDLSVLIISRNRKVLEPYYHVALPQEDVVEMLMDKRSFYKYALKENLPIPKTFLLYSRTDAEIAAENLVFPCIIKPPLKSPVWEIQTKTKAYKALNTREFIDIYDQCSKCSEVLIAQEWIPGSDANLFSCNCYFNANSEPIVTFTAKKIRQWPPETGETSLGEECRNDVVLNESIRLFKKIHFRGLGYLEMKQDERTGKHYIIEPNIGRPTGRSALAEECGVDLLYTMYCDIVGWPIQKNIVQKYVGGKWINLLPDTLSALHYFLRGDLTVLDWCKSFRGRKTYAILSLSDPLPFLWQLQYGFNKIYIPSLLNLLGFQKVKKINHLIYKVFGKA
jgi:predicted ATP-grasp superfamily ATP-dependent carboligase